MREYLSSFQKLEFDKVKSYIQQYVTSSLGKEHVDALTPSSDISVIQENLAKVSEMKRLIESDDPLPLENLPDARTSLHRSSIENYILPSEELHRISLVLRASKLIRSYFSQRQEKYPLLASRVSNVHPENVLEYNINRAIDDDGHVRDSASRELAAIRREIVEKTTSLGKSLERILKSVAEKDWIQEEIITTRDGRMVIPVKVEHKNRVPGFIHSASASGATVYIEPTETLELNNEVRTLQFEEQHEIERILRDLTDQVREARERVLQNLHVLGELDFVYAKARYSIEIGGTEPRVVLDSPIRLQNAYHPILLRQHSRSDVVPLNIEITNDFNTLVITGPNAGGKSVLMKTIGLLSLMMQSGCHIPVAYGSELRVFSEIFVDMGDEQSIENDLSSFSSHLQNLKAILENARRTSLVLIDEIGSGTDPTEGYSLAAAILEQLANVGSLNIATTHHGTLKSFAYAHPLIRNGGMEFDQITLRPTYRFRLGIPGSSYAIEMAERIKVPSNIIQRSRELKGEAANKLEQLIIDLERQSQELRRNLEHVNEEKQRLNNLNLVYQSRVTSLQKELKELKLRAVDEAKHIVERANALVEKSIRQIRESAASRPVIKKTKEELLELRKEFSHLSEELTGQPTDTELRIGDVVRLKHGKTEGTITERLDDDHFFVLMGEKRVKANKRELEVASCRSLGNRRSAKSAQVQATDLRREIDLRGMYGDEAVIAVDKFIDEAIVAGLHRIDIIHGKGTGALRRKISEHLKTHAAIKSFRLGEWNEGGTGVTVVELQ